MNLTTIGNECSCCGKPTCGKISDWKAYLECSTWCHCNDNKEPFLNPTIIIIQTPNDLLGQGPTRTLSIKPEWPEKIGECFIASIDED